MALSARNHLKGTVKSTKLGTIMAEVVVDVGATRSCQVTQDRLDAIAAELQQPASTNPWLPDTLTGPGRGVA